MLVEYGGSRLAILVIVSANPADLAVVAIVSKKLKVLTKVGR
jgi:hypothetical protein